MAAPQAPRLEALEEWRDELITKRREILTNEDELNRRRFGVQVRLEVVNQLVDEKLMLKLRDLYEKEHDMYCEQYQKLINADSEELKNIARLLTLLNINIKREKIVVGIKDE
jgi:hypothetical protein